MANVYSDAFEKAMRYVFRVEGREYAVDPNPSSHGVEQAEYDTFRGSQGQARQSVRYITDAEAKAIFYAKYYTSGNAVSGGLPSPATIKDPYLSLVVFDTAINPMRGIWAAIKPIFNNGELTDRQKAKQIIAKRREFYQRSAYNKNGALDNRLNALVATAVNYPDTSAGGVLVAGNPTKPPTPKATPAPAAAAVKAAAVVKAAV